MKIPRWVSRSIIGLGVLGTLFYFFAVKPTLDVEKNAPAEIIKTVEAFHACWGINNLEACKPLMTEVMLLSADEYFKINNPISNKLGKRLSGELIPSTIKISTRASLIRDDKFTSVSAQYKSIYEKDISVTEYYAFITYGKSGDYKINAFKVNSPEFGK